jgi:hypothetical protein
MNKNPTKRGKKLNISPEQAAKENEANLIVRKAIETLIEATRDCFANKCARDKIPPVPLPVLPPATHHLSLQRGALFPTLTFSATSSAYFMTPLNQHVISKIDDGYRNPEIDQGISVDPSILNSSRRRRGSKLRYVGPKYAVTCTV